MMFVAMIEIASIARGRTRLFLGRFWGLIHS